jgi:hypothetical protein
MFGFERRETWALLLFLVQTPLLYLIFIQFNTQGREIYTHIVHFASVFSTLTGRVYGLYVNPLQGPSPTQQRKKAAAAPTARPPQ